MNITSTEFQNGNVVPSRFTCDGENIPPTIEIHDKPDDTQKLALLMDDPDAPGGTFTHWVIWNIDPSVEVFESDEIPLGGVEGKNSAGNVGYTGPCPPDDEEHQYHFIVYALDNELNLLEGADREDFEAEIAGHIIQEAELVGRYSRVNTEK